LQGPFCGTARISLGAQERDDSPRNCAVKTSRRGEIDYRDQAIEVPEHHDNWAEVPEIDSIKKTCERQVRHRNQ
jgi:hypothetical protein